jgi:glutamyl-tRNA reductase
LDSSGHVSRAHSLLLEQRPVGLASSELLVVGTSYKTSNLQFREELARLFSARGLRAIRSFPGVTESALLSTCNRLELYLVTTSPESTVHSFTDFLKRRLPDRSFERAIFASTGLGAVAHLFRVAAGLESVVLGESQILAQVNHAGRVSRRAGTSKGVLSPLFDRASRVGVRVRTSYDFGSGESSLSDLAVEAVLESVPPKPDVLLIGTGKVVQFAARRLQGKARRFYVATRRNDVPRALAESVLIPYREIPKVAKKCDAVISATTTEEPLLAEGDFDGRRKRVIVDLGMPRNISGSVRDLPGVSLVDLDDLAKKAHRSKSPRELKEGEGAVSREATEFYAWLVQTRLSSIISELFAWANGVRDEESARAVRRLGLSSARERRVVEAMGRRIVSKIMARPVRFARSRHGIMTEEEKLDLLRSVFGGRGGIEDQDTAGD